MKSQRIFLGMLMLVVAAVVVAGCGSSGSSSEEPAGGNTASGGESESAGAGSEEGNSPFVIVASVDKTGPTKLYAPPELAGIEGAAKVINEEGGILGHPIKVETLNDNGDAQTGASGLIGWFGSHPKPQSVFPGLESTMEGAKIPIACREKVFIASHTDGNGLFNEEHDPGSTCPYGFEVQGSVVPAQEAAAKWFEEKGIKNVGILAGEFAYGESEVPVFEEILDEKGIEHTTVKANLEATSYTSQLDQLKSAGAEGLYLVMVGVSAYHVFGARAELEWEVPMLGEEAFASENYPETVPASQLKSAYYLQAADVPTNTKVPGVALLKETIGEKKLQSFGTPINVTSLAWDTVVVDKYAAEKAGSIEPEAMAKALEEAGEWTDPMLATASAMKYSAENHENHSAVLSEIPIIPVGSYVNGQIPTK
jgi:ABC-type branched-subunit amino acid transport system substrate-binding protein